MSMLVDEDERPEHDGEPPLRCTMVLCPGAILLSAVLVDATGAATESHVLPGLRRLDLRPCRISTRRPYTTGAPVQP